MPTTISMDALDRILALQLSVAWAGERHGDPPSLGWWETSLADPEGGGDFLQRMFPRTHVWAALGSMREAARRADTKAREQTAPLSANVNETPAPLEFTEQGDR